MSRVPILLGALSLIVLLLSHDALMAEATGAVSARPRSAAGGEVHHSVRDQWSPRLGCPAGDCAQLHPAAPITGPRVDAAATASGPGAACVDPWQPRAAAPNRLPVTQSPAVRRALLQVYRE